MLALRLPQKDWMSEEEQGLLRRAASQGIWISYRIIVQNLIPLLNYIQSLFLHILYVVHRSSRGIPYRYTFLVLQSTVNQFFDVLRSPPMVLQRTVNAKGAEILPALRLKVLRARFAYTRGITRPLSYISTRYECSTSCIDLSVIYECMGRTNARQTSYSVGILTTLAHGKSASLKSLPAAYCGPLGVDRSRKIGLSLFGNNPIGLTENATYGVTATLTFTKCLGSLGRVTTTAAGKL